jgi:magnesium chelatase subunit D
VSSGSRTTDDIDQSSVVGGRSSVGQPSSVFPFTAIVGQERMKRALVLNAIHPAIGGVLIRGEKGTAKSTAARALARLLPILETIVGCPFACSPEAPFEHCPTCGSEAGEREFQQRRAPLVSLPLGATEDRVLGTLNLERAIKEGARVFEPGLLAAAHRGILYIDEVNLLSDHLVDILLDSAAMGVNVVEREGISIQHPARFMLVGTMNPEEGELRPQLLDRFGLAVDVNGTPEPADRAEIVRRRIDFEAEPTAFAGHWEPEENAERARIRAGMELLPAVQLPDRMLSLITRLCSDLQVDGLRADIVIYKTAQANAAYEGRARVLEEDVQLAAELALPHRRRRGPFQQPRLDPEELQQALERAKEEQEDAHEPGDGGEDEGDGQEEVFGVESSHPISLPGPANRATSVSTGRRSGSGTNDSSGPISGVVNFDRGHSRSLALGDTLRAAARRQIQGATRGNLALQIAADDIRVYERTAQVSNLVLFLIDSSGSMGSRRRMSAVKSAVLGMLTDAYQKRDRVALIAFRGSHAEVLLPPTTSVDQAEQRLRQLPTGGRTPLADGLRLALETLQRATGNGSGNALLVLVTDGRPNVATVGGDAWTEAREMGERIAELGFDALVVDTEVGRLRLGLAPQLARVMLAPCILFDALQDGGLLAAVRQRLRRHR